MSTEILGSACKIDKGNSGGVAERCSRGNTGRQVGSESGVQWQWCSVTGRCNIRVPSVMGTGFFIGQNAKTCNSPNECLWYRLLDHIVLI